MTLVSKGLTGLSVVALFILAGATPVHAQDGVLVWGKDTTGKSAPYSVRHPTVPNVYFIAAFGEFYPEKVENQDGYNEIVFMEAREANGQFMEIDKGKRFLFKGKIVRGENGKLTWNIDGAKHLVKVGTEYQEQDFPGFAQGSHWKVIVSAKVMLKTIPSTSKEVTLTGNVEIK